MIEGFVKNCQIPDGDECDQCKENFIYVSSLKQCQYNPVFLQSINCVSGHINTNGTYYCDVCRAGYYRNYDDNSECYYLDSSILNFTRNCSQVSKDEDDYYCEACYDGF